jgi:hypothetical protein
MSTRCARDEETRRPVEVFEDAIPRIASDTRTGGVSFRSSEML